MLLPINLFLLLQNNAAYEAGRACGWVFMVILGGYGVYWIYQSNRRAKATQQARDSYQHALQRLRSTPGNPHFKAQALQLGRAYSNLTRDKRGVAIFDEAALMNDIESAVGGKQTTVSNRTVNGSLS